MEPQTERTPNLVEVKGLLKATFPNASLEEINEVVDLCARNGRLIYLPAEHFILGYWRYWPSQVNAVEFFKWRELEKENLRAGPILHLAILVTPTPGYKMTRELIDTVNPLGVSCHRFRSNVNRYVFRFQRNVRYKPEVKP